MTSEGMRAEFRIGGVLGGGFSILFSNIVPFTVLAMLINSPTYFFALSEGTTIEQSAEADLLIAMFMTLLSIVMYAALTAALAYGTFQELRGRHPSFGDCVAGGFRVMFPVLGVAIVVGICVGLGTAAFVVPGIFLAVALWVAIPVAVIERPGVLNSLGRSWELTKGYRWHVFGIIVLLVLLQMVSGFVVLAIMGGTSGFGVSTTALIADWLLTAFFGALYAVVSTVGYYGLRATKEGVGIQQIAAVFD